MVWIIINSLLEECLEGEDNKDQEEEEEEADDIILYFIVLYFQIISILFK
jgi:hypothetical protein